MDKSADQSGPRAPPIGVLSDSDIFISFINKNDLLLIIQTENVQNILLVITKTCYE